MWSRHKTRRTTAALRAEDSKEKMTGGEWVKNVHQKKNGERPRKALIHGELVKTIFISKQCGQQTHPASVLVRYLLFRNREGAL